jgi:chromatin assembly factor 1 subunit B
MKRSLVIDEVKQPETGQKDVNDVEMAEADGIKQPVPADENSRLISNTPCRPFSHAQATPRTPAVKRSMKIYHDETVLTFFRRLTFTPDGALLITPTGMYRNSNNNSVDTPVNVTFIYARNRMKAGPCVFLPGYQRPSTLVRCNPVRYSLRKFKDGTQPSVFALPYRYIFAVASLDSVFIYDTQQTQPIYQMSNLHYATLNDLAWSNDGQMLIITSADGYCSVACFDRNELGESIEV